MKMNVPNNINTRYSLTVKQIVEASLAVESYDGKASEFLKSYVTHRPLDSKAAFDLTLIFFRATFPFLTDSIPWLEDGVEPVKDMDDPTEDDLVKLSRAFKYPIDDILNRKFAIMYKLCVSPEAVDNMLFWEFYYLSELAQKTQK